MILYFLAVCGSMGTVPRCHTDNHGTAAYPGTAACAAMIRHYSSDTRRPRRLYCVRTAVAR